MLLNRNVKNISGMKAEKSSQNHFIRSDLMTKDLKMLRNAEISACNAEELIDLRNVTVNISQINQFLGITGGGID